MDTSAWIELFRGSPEGVIVKKHISHRDSPPLLTISIVITEMRSAYFRDGKDEQFYEDFEKIKEIGTIEEKLEENLAIISGEKHATLHNRQNQVSYVDCILWSMAEKKNMRVITTDKHFEKCPNAIYIKKKGTK